MATATPPPRLQIAQILADLSDLNVAEPEAALSLVAAPQHLHPAQQKLSRTPKSNKTPLSTPSSSHLSQNDRRRSGTTPPPTVTPGTLSRTLSRNDSSGSGISGTGSGTGSGSWERFQTPSPGVEADPDLERASMLMHLYEMRGTFKQQENGGLARARANVEAVAERYRKFS